MSVPLTLLGLLERGPSHGYDLKGDYDAGLASPRPLKDCPRSQNLRARPKNCVALVLSGQTETYHNFRDTLRTLCSFLSRIIGYESGLAPAACDPGNLPLKQSAC